MRLYLIEHGKQYVKGNEYFKAHLSKEGINKGKELLKNGIIPKPDKIYSSHFIRAIESAKIIAEYFRMGIIIKESLGEWKIQELNLDFEKFLEEEKLARQNLNLVVSGGESLAMARDRIYKCVLEICEENVNAKNIVVVSHGNVLYLLFKKLLNQKPKFDESEEQIKYFDYGILDYKNKQFKVMRNIISDIIRHT